MTKAEEQAIILKWVYDTKKFLEPKKRGPKSDEDKIDDEDDINVDEEGRRYRLNGYKHRVYLSDKE